MLERTRLHRSRPPLARASLALDDAVETFWARYRERGAPSRSAVAALGDHALAAERAEAEGGTRVLFERVIEPLCDAFTAEGAEAYRRVFAQLVTIARRRPGCARLDRELGAAGIRTEDDLVRPASAPPPLGAAERTRVRRVVLLSRLTLGADVAICAPALRRLRSLFPAARTVLVGGAGAHVLASAVGVEHSPVEYRRAGTLAERLNAWPSVRAAVRRACAEVDAERYVVVDPDSRLTQLGLLPPAPPARCYHFPSRSYAPERDEPLGVLVGRWLDATFGACSAPASGLALPPAEIGWARALRDALGAGRLVAVSFGVGGNARKRAGPAFELDLIERLVRRGYRVLLARGVATDEIAESFRLGARLAARRIEALHLPPGRDVGAVRTSRAPVVTWEADVAAFFAAIACADLYVGYDSAGQHVAAALGVPTVSVFLQSAGPRHAARWRPHGAGPVRVVDAAVPADPERLVARVCGAVASLDRGGQR